MYNIKRYSQSSSSAVALNCTINPGGAMLHSVYVHVDASVTSSEDLTISVDSVDGADYDTVFATQDLQNLTDYVYIPSAPLPFKKGDIIKVAYPNSDTNTVGVQVSVLE